MLKIFPRAPTSRTLSFLCAHVKWFFLCTTHDQTRNAEEFKGKENWAKFAIQLQNESFRISVCQVFPFRDHFVHVCVFFFFLKQDSSFMFVFLSVFDCYKVARNQHTYMHGKNIEIFCDEWRIKTHIKPFHIHNVTWMIRKAPTTRCRHLQRPGVNCKQQRWHSRPERRPWPCRQGWCDASPGFSSPRRSRIHSPRSVVRSTFGSHAKRNVRAICSLSY